MEGKENISSILEAINEINTKPKKNTVKISEPKISIPKLNQNLAIPPDVDKLIKEAEKYKKKLIISSSTFPIKNRLIHENKQNALILTEEVVGKFSNLNIKNPKIIKQNNKIQNLEGIIKKLRYENENLKKNKSLILKEDNDNLKSNESKNFISNTKENLKSIYSQVEKQKKIFLDLKNHSIKIERDSTVYKENYERLIIENNDLKTRLKITKEQIANYETNKKELLSALDQLNEILSKSNIVGKISPNKSVFKSNDIKKDTKIDSID